MENPLDTQADAFDSAGHPMARPALAPQKALGEYLRSRREADEMSVDQISRTTKIPRASLEHLEAGRFDKLPGDVFVRGFLRSYARCLKLDGDDVVSRYAQCGLNPAPVSSELAETVLAHNTSETPAKRPRRFPKATRSPQAHATNPQLGALERSSSGRSVSERSVSERSVSAASTATSASANPEASSGLVKSELARSETVRRVLRDAFDLRNRQRSSAKETRQTPAEDDVEVAKPERSRTFVPPRLDYNDEMSHRGPLTLGVIILVIVATLTMSYLLRRPGTSVDGFTMAPAPGLFGEGVPALAVDGTQDA